MQTQEFLHDTRWVFYTPPPLPPPPAPAADVERACGPAPLCASNTNLAGAKRKASERDYMCTDSTLLACKTPRGRYEFASRQNLKI